MNSIRQAAIDISQSNVTITYSNFMFNNNFFYGGAVEIYSSRVTIEYSSFVNNFARSYGGAVGIRQQSHVDISNCSFKWNRVNDYGGALAIRSSRVIITDSLFVHNYSGGYGGTIAVLRDDATAIITNTCFANNRAENSNSGSIATFDSSLVTIYCSHLFNNSANDNQSIQRISNSSRVVFSESDDCIESRRDNNFNSTCSGKLRSMLTILV